MLDAGALNKDLYDSSSEIGYYFNLNRLNKENEGLAEIFKNTGAEKTRQESLLTTYTAARDAAQEDIQKVESEILQHTGAKDWENVQAYLDGHEDDTTV